MHEEIKKQLPKEILESTDVDMFRRLRDFADATVQELKRKNTEAALDTLRPKFEGKTVLVYGYNWEGPVRAENLNDIHIVKIHRIMFVGNGFISCDVSVLRIKHGGSRELLDDAGLGASDFSELLISSYNDRSYHLDYNSEYRYLSEVEVDAYKRHALFHSREAINWFTNAAQEDK